MNLPLAALVGGAALALHFLPRRAPALGLLVGLGLLGFAAYLATAFDRGDFQTEGSPAGALLAVVYLSFGLLAIAAGLYLLVACALRLMRPDASAASPARVAPIGPVLPPDLSTCRLWLTPEACAAGAMAEARELGARSCRPVVVAQDAGYQALIGALPDAAPPVPVLASHELRIQPLRRLTEGVARVDLLCVGRIADARNEELVIDLLERGTQQVTVTRHLSLDDLQRGGLHVGRARTAAAALQLREDRPLDHPMVRDAIDRAVREAGRA